MKKERIKPIPEKIYNKIIQCAVNKEKDILTKAGILIQSLTGLKILDMLALQEGCVKEAEEKDSFGSPYYLDVRIDDEKKGTPGVHRIYVSKFLKKAIDELSEYTADLRKESGLKELFLIRREKIKVLSYTYWGCIMLPKFAKRHNIVDAEGKLFHIKSSGIRASYLRDSLSHRIPYAGYVPYTNLQKEINDVYFDMFFAPGRKIVGHQAERIATELKAYYAGKSGDELEEAICSLIQTVVFYPFPEGICLCDCYSGEPCLTFACKQFLTCPSYYFDLKKKLDELEAKMAMLKESGYERELQRQSIIYEDLKPAVDALEAIQKEEGIPVGEIFLPE